MSIDEPLEIRFCRCVRSLLLVFSAITKCITVTIKSAKTIEKFPSLKFGRKIEAKHYQFYENISIINGMGGRGFVLAPFIAKKLVDFLINNKEIEKELLPDRFFNRWVKRIKDK